MINIDEFRKVDLRIEEVGGEKVAVVVDGKNKRALVASGVLIVPDGEIDSGAFVH